MEPHKVYYCSNKRQTLIYTHTYPWHGSNYQPNKGLSGCNKVLTIQESIISSMDNTNLQKKGQSSCKL